MLKKRVFTAVPLAAAALLLVWTLPTAWLALLMAVLSAWAAWEWAALSGLKRRNEQLMFAAGVGALLAVLWTLGAAGPLGIEAWALPAGAWWLGMLAVLTVRSRQPDLAAPSRNVRLGSGAVTLVLAWLGLVALHGQPDSGPFWLTLCFLLVWGADIGAFFAGRHFGRVPLAPALSPKKTWEGVAGGALLAVGLLVLFVGLGRGMGLVLPSTPALMLLGVIVVAASVVGDLTESLLKRWAGAKDSGQVLPGHGGILDRVDALLAGAPVMAIGVLVLEG